MTRLLGITASAPEDWPLTTLGWIFSIALFMLGASAALFGKWLEEVGPRKAMFTSALCFASGFFVAAFGVYIHNIWMVYLGHGVLGGIGLGLGYISPVSTLIKWFPDRPGLATGMAIMGFGGGAMIASPLSVRLMKFFHTHQSVGVAETFVTMGIIYFVVMMYGVFTVRVPAATWKPEGYDPAVHRQNAMITTAKGAALNFRCPYHANVMKTFDNVSSSAVQKKVIERFLPQSLVFMRGYAGVGTTS